MKKAKGDKIKNHTTVIDAAAPIVKYASRLPQVDRIVPGFLKTGIKNMRSHQSKVKLTHQGGCIYLQIRGNISMQEVRVFTKDTQSVLESIASYAVENDYRIEFGVDEVAERKRERQAADTQTKPSLNRRRMR